MKARAYYLMLAAIALLTSCSDDTLTNTTQTPEQGGGKSVYLETTAGLQTPPKSRMHYEEDASSTDVGMKETWSTTGEYIGVVSYQGTASNVQTVTLKADNKLPGIYHEEAPNLMTFAGTMNDASTGKLEGAYNFYYPVVDNVVSTIDEKNGNAVIYDYTLQENTLTETSSGHLVGDPEELNAFDVMYTKQAVDPTTAGSLGLTRASTLLRFVLPLPASTPQITKIELSATTAVFCQQLKLTYYKSNDGTVNAVCTNSSGTISMRVNNDATDRSARTITAYMLTPGEVNLDGQTVRVSAISESTKGGSTVYSHTYSNMKGQQLNTGLTYTFAPSEALAVEDRWASSNIYWDGQKLTFDGVKSTLFNEFYQGVFFKWGSLIGISPAQHGSNDNTWDNGEVNIYMTSPYTGGSAVMWDGAKKAADVGYADYTDIPAFDIMPNGPGTNSLYYTSQENKTAQWANYKGDICQFLGEIGAAPSGYRLPRSDEFYTDSHWQNAASYPSRPANDLGTDDGQKKMSAAKGWAQWIDSGKYFPASGYRSTNGELGGVGNKGYYWSSSSASQTHAYSLVFSNIKVYPYNNKSSRGYACPIRCIKN
jgi:uncharacterized protein (TIGR02145 family)